jgi:hypothetical protein
MKCVNINTEMSNLLMYFEYFFVLTKANEIHKKLISEHINHIIIYSFLHSVARLLVSPTYKYNLN